MRKVWGKLVVLVAALVIVGSLTGCGVQRAGLAASIGDKKLTIATVNARIAAYFDAYPTGAPGGPSEARIGPLTVQNFLRAVIVDITAADNGITASETEIDDFITRFGGTDTLYQAVATQGVPPDPTLARIEVRSAILQTKLQDLAGPNADDFARAAALTDRTDATTARLRIEVNPRFGRWSGTTVDVVNGSLSLTEAETVATPTPTLSLPTGSGG